MNKLHKLLASDIRARGPVSLAHYMQACLTHPRYGYYMRSNPIGREGDFITAPEISQIFGELLGLWLADRWLSQGAPSSFSLVELGPGRGTLMADILRATAKIPGFNASANIMLFECSSTLRELQKQTLTGYRVQWFSEFDRLMAAPLYLVANEFFDALPIRQFVCRQGVWHELLVGIDEQQHLTPGLGVRLPSAKLPSFEHLKIDEGAVFNFCSDGEQIATAIGRRISEHGGAALIADYGYDDAERQGGKANLHLQAVANHQFVDAYSSPGEADLSTLVDFSALARAADPCNGTINAQGEFLISLGLFERAKILAKSNKSQEQEILGACERLSSSEQMGRLFKILTLEI